MSECSGFTSTKVGGEEESCSVNRLKSAMALLDTFRQVPKELPELQSCIKQSQPCPPPVASSYLPSSHFGSLTERVDQLIEDYLNTKDEAFFPKDKFRDMLCTKFQLATVAAGEPVGILAAQSVGEPSTQMTLNTFHFAGRGEMNVTLGIPRLREILMVASANIKTPSMDIPFKPGVGEKEMDRLRLRINRVLLSDILERVEVTEMISLRPIRARNVALRFNFLPYKHYKHNFGVKPSQVLDYFEKKFIMKTLLPVLAAVMKEKKVLVESTVDGDGAQKKKSSKDDDDREGNNRMMEDAAGFGMGEVESDEDVEAEDNEGTDVTRQKERQQDREYEDLEEEEIEMNKQLDDDFGDEYVESTEEDSKNNLQLDQDEGLGEEVEENEAIVDDVEEETMVTGEAARRRATVLRLLDGRAGMANVVDYTYDTEHESWCCLTLGFDVSRKRVDMSNVLRQAASKGVVYEVKHLKRAFVLEENGQKILKTDGINIDAMVRHDNLLDIGRLSCNNIHDMAKYYGIESAAKTIVREMTNVFKVYGIEVDKRHLSLIADYMTFDGSYKPFNRVGIENNPSPLQQMTFETAMGFLRSATLGGKTDSLTSPSACVVLGKPTKGGTGAFGLQYKFC